MLSLMLARHCLAASPLQRLPELRDPVVDRVLDIVGCSVAGTRSPQASAFADVVQESAGELAPGAPAATVPGRAHRLSAMNAAMATAVLARSFDFGVLTPFREGEPIWSHISESTVPTALAAAQAGGHLADGMLDSLIVADDLAARLSRSLRFVPGTGWDSPGLINRFATAVIAARAADLTPSQLVNAWGLVLQSVSGTFQAIEEGVDAFTIVQGLAARDGFMAVELAARGFTGGSEPFEGRFGLFTVFGGGGGVDDAVLLDGLGAGYLGDQIYKPYPGCRFVHSTVEAALTLREAGAASDPEGITGITVTVAAMHEDSPLNRAPGTAGWSRPAALFSLQYQVANALVRGLPRLQHFTDDAVDDRLVLRLARRVTVQAGLDSRNITGSRVEIFGDGDHRTVEVDYAWGDPRARRPFMSEDVLSKCADNLAFARPQLGIDAAEQASAELARALRLNMPVRAALAALSW